MDKTLVDVALFASSLARSLDEAHVEGRLAAAHALEHGLLECPPGQSMTTLLERVASLSEWAWLTHWHTANTRGWAKALAVKQILS